MGICKCRKRSEFCIIKEDSSPVFVCPDCVVSDEHATAHVLLYKDWLANPNSKVSLVCPLTKKAITEGDNTIRLTNFQLFHLDAVVEYGSKFSENATPTIPGTLDPLCPPADDTSKLAQQIRKKLSSHSWFRTSQPINEAPNPANRTVVTSRAVPQRKNEETRIDIETPSSIHTKPPPKARGKKRLGKKCCIRIGFLKKKDARSKEYQIAKLRVGFTLFIIGAIIALLLWNSSDSGESEDEDIQNIITKTNGQALSTDHPSQMKGTVDDPNAKESSDTNSGGNTANEKT